ncbi:MAG: AAA family ATPase [Polyangiaceae bacterium]
MPVHVPIGIEDFRKIRESGLEYVDKSHLIRELLDMPGAEVVLIPRPRRFGKSLNLSMLRCFFEKREEDLARLFEGLSIWGAGGEVRAHFQRYPVLYLTLKGSKHDTFEACWASLREKIADLFVEHREALESARLDEVERGRVRQILDGTAGRELYDRALFDLSRYLHRAHGEKVVILIDEYDEPIHAGHAGGYERPILDFFRAFFTEGLKGNPHVFKAVLTGILRIARESIFSGLNNVAVFSLLRPELSTCFGFTEAEVQSLLEKAGRADRIEDVRLWYNGYLFGDTVVYNPWSVVNFVADARAEARPYWVSTSSNDLIKRELTRRAVRLEPVFEELLGGGGVERVIDESTVLEELDRNDDALFSLLVFSGYLKASRRARGPAEQAVHYLTIPNREVRLVYQSTFREWLASSLHAQGGSVDRLVRSVLGGDALGFEEELQVLATSLLSYHDGGVRAEQLYQGFLVGLLAVMEPDYRVRSNRESGKGRPDVLITPVKAGAPGVVMELKVARAGRKTLEQALEEGVAQIESGDYEAELRAAGAATVRAFAVAFDGKQVRVRAAKEG